MAKKEQSLKYELGKGNQIIADLPNRKTARQYLQHVDRFCQWLADRHGIKRRSQLIKVFGTDQAAVQTYADDLQRGGYTASTVHDYIAGICRATGLSLKEIEKPRRITADNIRSRTAAGRNKRAEQEIRSGRFDRLIDFQTRIGIRRAELARLTGDDFVTDESGQPCVRVKKGKGGKLQLQNIFPWDVETVRSYFTGKDPDERIFTEREMNNHLDLHGLRHDHAKACYTYYTSMTDPERDELRARLIRRYKAHAKKPARVRWWISQIDKDDGRYRLRGANAEKAREQGLPLEYDRLALMAVSVFHLSHWRFDVTISNYMLAV